MASMDNEEAIKAALTPVWTKVLTGQTVKLGVFGVHENFVYKREKDPRTGEPLYDRVISLQFYDEEDIDTPSNEPFDGTLESFIEALKAHNVLEYYSDTEEIIEGYDEQ